MPYLDCPECRLSVFSAPAGTRPQRCPRCGAGLGDRPRSMFALPPRSVQERLEAGVRLRQLEDLARRELTSRGADAPREVPPPPTHCQWEGGNGTREDHSAARADTPAAPHFAPRSPGFESVSGPGPLRTRGSRPVSRSPRGSWRRFGSRSGAKTYVSDREPIPVTSTSTPAKPSGNREAGQLSSWSRRWSCRLGYLILRRIRRLRGLGPRLPVVLVSESAH
jgi:hypothetical protein